MWGLEHGFYRTAHGTALLICRRQVMLPVRASMLDTASARRQTVWAGMQDCRCRWLNQLSPPTTSTGRPVAHVLYTTGVLQNLGLQGLLCERLNLAHVSPASEGLSLCLQHEAIALSAFPCYDVCVTHGNYGSRLVVQPGRPVPCSVVVSCCVASTGSLTHRTAMLLHVVLHQVTPRLHVAAYCHLPLGMFLHDVAMLHVMHPVCEGTALRVLLHRSSGHGIMPCGPTCVDWSFLT